MKIMLETMPWSIRSNMRRMTLFCVETSSAEVGSSAITTLGLSRVEIPITTRCLMPAGSCTG